MSSDFDKEYMTTDDLFEFLKSYNRGQFDEKKLRNMMGGDESQIVKDDYLMMVALCMAKNDEEIEKIKEMLTYYHSAQYRRRGLN